MSTKTEMEKKRSQNWYLTMYRAVWTYLYMCMLCRTTGHLIYSSHWFSCYTTSYHSGWDSQSLQCMNVQWQNCTWRYIYTCRCATLWNTPVHCTCVPRKWRSLHHVHRRKLYSDMLTVKVFRCSFCACARQVINKELDGIFLSVGACARQLVALHQAV